MEGKITKDGELVIKRKDKLVLMGCPFVKETQPDGKGIAQTYCCDRCALFGEPEAEAMPSVSNALEPT